MGPSEFSWEENFSFWKNMFLVGIFFIITPVTLGVSLFSLFSLDKLSKSETFQAPASYSMRSGVRIYASLPSTFPAISAEVGSADARIELVRQYLERYNSPLVPLADYLIRVSDQYGLDFRLLTAIAQQESNLCKLIPPGSHNCWGWGIHSEGSLGFSSYQEAIDNVAKGIREEYLDKGYITTEEIMSKYTPLSNGSWANGVNTFMEEME